MKVVIRQLTPDDDFAQVCALVKRAFQIFEDRGLKPSAMSITPEFAQSISRAHQFFAAEVDGKVVGTIALSTPSEWSYGRYTSSEPIGILKLLSVDPNLQGQGIGYALMTHVEAAAKEQGCHECVLSAADRMTELVEWYEKLGYKHHSKTRWDGTDHQSCIMVKSLMPPDVVVIRPRAETDSFEALTELLHASYRKLAEMDLHFVATHQAPEVTQERASDGQLFILEVNGQLAGTITVRNRGTEPYGSYKPKVSMASFGQFAVHPNLQGKGFGVQLIQHAEAYAKELGCEEIGLDTAQGADHLISYYKKLGYKIAGPADWRPEVNYESWIMVKSLVAKAAKK